MTWHKELLRFLITTEIKLEMYARMAEEVKDTELSQKLRAAEISLLSAEQHLDTTKNAASE